MDFKLTSDYQPTGDQPKAIKELTEGVNSGDSAQVLLGVTGSGKTFTIANLIQQTQKPTLVLSHNKTLAAQLYGEFKQFFPENAVEYFISYYDYYQPEAFIPSSGTYIEKDLSINQEIEKLRLSASSSLLTGRRDVIVVASVSCIYGIGNPEEFSKNVLRLQEGDRIPRNQLLFKLVDILYSRTQLDLTHGTFRVKGDTVDVFVAYADFAYRIFFWGDEIEAIQRVEPATGKKLSDEKIISIFPANLFVTGRDTIDTAIREIQDDMVAQVNFFEKEGKYMEEKRLQERTEFDMEIASEFLLMAATLLQIKSRMLLPKQTAEGEEDETDPRQLLVEMLVEYRRIKVCASNLAELKLQAERCRYRLPLLSGFVERSLKQYEAEELISAMLTLLSVKTENTAYIERQEFNVQDKMNEIVHMLSQHLNGVEFAKVFSRTGSRSEKVASFLAVLELLKLGVVTINQTVAFAPIYIFLRQGER